MPTPILTFRVKPEQRKAVRSVVNAIKDDPKLTRIVLTTIRARSTPSPAGRAGKRARNLGPFRDEAAALSFLVGRLRAALRPEAIFLFGSRAGGAPRPDSDFDLLVVLPDDAPEAPDHFAAYAPVAGCGIGVDVVPCLLADYEAERTRPGTIPFAAEHGGKLLYARPGSRLRDRYRDQKSRR